LLIFLTIVACFIVFMFFLYRNTDSPVNYSKGFLVLVLFSLIINISLAQNYTYSLIPNISDGIGISNFLAYLVINDEGIQWSQELFKQIYDYSTLISLGLIIIYSILLLIEKYKFK
jgi:hypothetical protein